MKSLIRKILKEDKDWGWAKDITDPIDDMSPQMIWYPYRILYPTRHQVSIFQ